MGEVKHVNNSFYNKRYVLSNEMEEVVIEKRIKTNELIMVHWATK